MSMASGAAAYTAGAGAYAKVGVESGVMAASPHRLIVMLFDGARLAIRSARLHMENGNMPEKGRSITRALDIVTQGLMAAVDRDKGGEVADNLNTLYEYIGRLLLEASLHNDVHRLDQADSLLGEIDSAWREIGEAAGEKA